MWRCLGRCRAADMLLMLLLLLTSIESFKLTEEAITLPILPSSFTILGFLVILMYILELLFTFLCASLVPKICKLPRHVFPKRSLETRIAEVGIHLRANLDESKSLLSRPAIPTRTPSIVLYILLVHNVASSKRLRDLFVVVACRRWSIGRIRTASQP
jgi:hypothetical protein